MNAEKRMSKDAYRSKNVGEYESKISVAGKEYVKVEDLRYGTNPHQTAALYKPADHVAPIADIEVLKSGKSGLSQTNYEDISLAVNICKFFETPTSVCMKHVNPSGVAVGQNGEPAVRVYQRSRDCDPQAAFGSVVVLNTTVDEDTAREIMGSFVEVVVAPEVTDAALDILRDHETFRRNKNIRVLRCGDFTRLPRFVGDNTEGFETLTRLVDGSLIMADPLLSNLRSADEIVPASGTDKEGRTVTAECRADERQKADLLAAWYISLNVRSNGVVLLKNGATLAVGTGQQDRVGAVEEAVRKYERKYQGEESMAGAVMASDGFFPFPDALDTAAEKGVSAVIAPAGALRDTQVIEHANQKGVAFCHAPERVFSHH